MCILPKVCVFPANPSVIITTAHFIILLFPTESRLQTRTSSSQQSSGLTVIQQAGVTDRFIRHQARATLCSW